MSGWSYARRSTTSSISSPTARRKADWEDESVIDYDVIFLSCGPKAPLKAKPETRSPVRIGIDIAKALPPRDGVYLKNRFRQHLGLGVN